MELYSFDDVEEKVLESEFFLGKMVESARNWSEFRFYISAYLSAARSITFALQRLKDIPGLDAWYQSHRKALSKNPIARFLLGARNNNVHGGGIPIASAAYSQNGAVYRFSEHDNRNPDDVLACCRLHFIELLKVVLDCYFKLGVHIDAQQYFTREHFDSMGLSIDDAEVEIWGWVMTSYIEEGLNKDERWYELRGQVSGSKLNHLFLGYLNKVTPQPNQPDYINDFEFSYDDRGWNHIPVGFVSEGDYKDFIQDFGVLIV
ncbi:hypothetical protein [Marinobacter excellens]|jgi:hypothetical protein|nr:hypothetical protein [Marinobacter excellens]